MSNVLYLPIVIDEGIRIPENNKMELMKKWQKNINEAEGRS